VRSRCLTTVTLTGVPAAATRSAISFSVRLVQRTLSGLGSPAGYSRRTRRKFSSNGGSRSPHGLPPPLFCESAPASLGASAPTRAVPAPWSGEHTPAPWQYTLCPHGPAWPLRRPPSAADPSPTRCHRTPSSLAPACLNTSWSTFLLPPWPAAYPTTPSSLLLPPPPSIGKLFCCQSLGRRHSCESMS
jgi:hypothetical protein